PRPGPGPRAPPPVGVLFPSRNGSIGSGRAVADPGRPHGPLLLGRGRTAVRRGGPPGGPLSEPENPARMDGPGRSIWPVLPPRPIVSGGVPSRSRVPSGPRFPWPQRHSPLETSGVRGGRHAFRGCHRLGRRQLSILWGRGDIG